jgi:hypothetical protein
VHTILSCVFDSNEELGRDLLAGVLIYAPFLDVGVEKVPGEESWM